MTRKRLRLLAVPVVFLGFLFAFALPDADEGLKVEKPRFVWNWSEPPAKIYDLNARTVVEQAQRTQVAKAFARAHTAYRTLPYRDNGQWWVRYYQKKVPLDRAITFDVQPEVEVQIDDATQRVTHAWSGYQAVWTIARGHRLFGRPLNNPIVFCFFALAFLAPFINFRRIFSLFHLDLLMLVAFGLAFLAFTLGAIPWMVGIVLALLAYFFCRLLREGFRRDPNEPVDQCSENVLTASIAESSGVEETGEQSSGKDIFRPSFSQLVPHAPNWLLLLGIFFFFGLNLAISLTMSDIMDVGVASVAGADRLAKGLAVYGVPYLDMIDAGDTYGPLNYFLYVPFEQIFPFSGAWDTVQAGRSASRLFDGALLLALFALGKKLRPGKEGITLGLALAYAWSTYPFAAMALFLHTNDLAVSLALVLGLIFIASPGARGVFSGAAAAIKIAPAALGPLFLRGTAARLKPRQVLHFCLGFGLIVVIPTLLLLPDGGFKEIFDRTVSFQSTRESPFSIWGGDLIARTDLVALLHSGASALVAGFCLALAIFPRGPRSIRQVAALTGAVLIAVQFLANYWFWLYIAWFAPFALIAFFLSRSTKNAEQIPARARPRADRARSQTAPQPKTIGEAQPTT